METNPLTPWRRTTVDQSSALLLSSLVGRSGAKVIFFGLAGDSTEPALAVRTSGFGGLAAAGGGVTSTAAVAAMAGRISAASAVMVAVSAANCGMMASTVAW